MRINSSITAKAVSLVLLISLFVLAVVHLYNYLVSRRIIIDLAEDNSRAVASTIVNRIAARLTPVETIIRNLAVTLENPDLTDQAIIDLTRAVVSRNEEIFASAIAFEPYSLIPDQLYFSPYSYRDGATVVSKMLGGSDYRYFHQNWYLLPKLLDRPVWTEPYHDTGGGDILMATYAVPFYRSRPDGGRDLAGIVTADISLAWLQDLLAGLKLYDSGYAVLLSDSGKFLYHPNRALILNETIFSLAESRLDRQLWEIGRDAVNGGTGFLERESYLHNAPSFFYYHPLPVGDWSLCFLFPRAEVLREITSLTRTTLTINLLGFLVLALAITWLTRRFTRPLITLSLSAQEIAGGNLDAAIPTTTSRDELGRLTVSFSEMQRSLRHHIERLTETTAQNERIESELRIARTIQMSILPKLFPPFPERSEFDIYASIRPAREIGGDLYDFFFIDQHRFCFLIGDVSDKGVPAAFFMAVTKTLLKVVADQHADPGAILTTVNSDLAEGNESCMFVTLFIGILDLRSGQLATGNAGHNSPIRLNGSGATLLPTPHEPLAGAMDGIDYTTTTFQLEAGDTLFLYTDGVTEAVGSDGSFYGEQRLLDTVTEAGGGNAEQIVTAVDDSVRSFCAGAEQFDDITMLCLCFHAPSPQLRTNGITALPPEPTTRTLTLRLGTDLHALEELAAGLAPLKTERLLSDRDHYQLRLVLDELITNTVSYGFSDGSDGTITIDITVQPERLLTVVYRDDGLPFDPLAADVPPEERGTEAVNFGGIGLSLVKSIMDDIAYRRQDDANIITMNKNLAADRPPPTDKEQT
ncbi:SpoIIE family protein phosphatase [Desulfofustis limnaeus]|uniref:IcfG protein n=1 Tax=Desulfofustis limnaeus TaxID=2740163 RepID=A0ABN6M635_9BACT|nr:SpoIIE family protein phosphatase [Desulfofustis limnaeus]BDD88353.1 IcfG protein [Desulfofustis limnaeus]